MIIEFPPIAGALLGALFVVLLLVVPFEVMYVLAAGRARANGRVDRSRYYERRSKQVLWVGLGILLLGLIAGVGASV